MQTRGRTSFVSNFDKFRCHLLRSPSFCCCIKTEPGNKTLLDVKLRMILLVGGIRWEDGLSSLMDLALNTGGETVGRKISALTTN